MDSDTKLQQIQTSFPSLESQIRTYDRQIFLELVKLAEFNVRYQQNDNHYARWRKIIYPLAQESVYGCLLAFSISDLSQRYRGWDNPGKISPTSTKIALEGAMVGTLIGGTSSLVELAANGVEECKARRLGYSNAKAISSVRSKVKLIDEALVKRNALMQQVDRNCASWEFLKLKEELLHYERERLLFEFKRWNAHSRGVAWNKNTFYIINSAVNFSRFSAITLGLKSFTAPRASGAIGPVLSTAASLAGLGPAAGSVAGNWVAKAPGAFPRKIATIKITPF